jgi:hypothetical protein
VGRLANELRSSHRYLLNIQVLANALIYSEKHGFENFADKNLILNAFWRQFAVKK